VPGSARAEQPPLVERELLHRGNDLRAEPHEPVDLTAL
jgi:hypothetical protein